MANNRKEPDTNIYSGRFAVRLRKLREKAGLTVDDIVEKSSIPRTTLYNWEAGISQPPVDTYPILAKAYGVKVRTLLPDE